MATAPNRRSLFDDVYITREPGGARRTDHARFHDVVPLATPRGE